MIILLLTILSISLSKYVNPQLFSITITITEKQRIQSISLRSLLISNQIYKVRLLMGHLIHRYNGTYFPNSNIAQIYSKQKLPDHTVTQVAQIFGISQSLPYRLWEQQLGLTIIADPNDKFCNDQFQHLLRLFLPCRNWVQAGLHQLHGIERLMKGFFCMELIWQSDQIIIKIIGEKDKKQELQKYSKYTACGWVNVNDFQLEGEQQLILRSISHKRFSLNKWYNPSKNLVFQIEQSIPLSHQNSSIVMIARLPPGFKVKDIAVFPKNQSIERKIVINNDSSTLINFEIKLPMKNRETLIHLYYQAHLPLIEQFQTIGGGGQELMGLTWVQVGKDRYELSTDEVSQSLLQPDFSMHFHTITAGIAIILVLWLTLWRNHELSPKKSYLEDKPVSE